MSQLRDAAVGCGSRGWGPWGPVLGLPAPKVRAPTPCWPVTCDPRSSNMAHWRLNQETQQSRALGSENRVEGLPVFTAGGGQGSVQEEGP